MRNHSAIPTLSSKQFRKVYLRPDVEPSSTNVHEKADGYFELMHRCLWSNTIAAHRLDFYMIFLVTSGEARHTFGSETHLVRPSTIGFAGPEMINAWHSEHHDNRGYVCTFSADFFGHEITGSPALAELPFFQLGGTSLFSLPTEKMAVYEQLFELMAMEAKSTHPLSAATLRSYLHVIINKSLADVHSENTHLNQIPLAGSRLVKAFREMFMSDINVIRTGHEIRLRLVSEYAHQLGVSQNHLNDTVRNITGESAGGLMQKQVILQATMCLKHSQKNVSELSYLLGFDDPSYFARFYKRHTGKTPSQVRAEIETSALLS